MKQNHAFLLLLFFHLHNTNQHFSGRKLIAGWPPSYDQSIRQQELDINKLTVTAMVGGAWAFVRHGLTSIFSFCDSDPKLELKRGNNNLSLFLVDFTCVTSELYFIQIGYWYQKSIPYNFKIVDYDNYPWSMAACKEGREQIQNDNTSPHIPDAEEQLTRTCSKTGVLSHRPGNELPKLTFCLFDWYLSSSRGLFKHGRDQTQPITSQIMHTCT